MYEQAMKGNKKARAAYVTEKKKVIFSTADNTKFGFR
jgi:hypothetical protein